MIRRIKGSLSSILSKYDRPTIHLLIVFFGASAWIGTNGIFVQTPLLINASPQKWELPAYLVILIQAANVVPAVYVTLQHFTQKVNEIYCIITVLSIGTIAMGLLIFFYDKTTVVNEKSYSIALFSLTYFTALVGCSSSVIFMPYLRKFKEVYLVSYFIGEGLSGVLPSVLSLIQGVTENQKCTTRGNNNTDYMIRDLRFTPNYYFLCLFIILLLSFMSFLMLHYSTLARKELTFPKSTDTVKNTVEYVPDTNSTVTDNYINVEKIERCKSINTNVSNKQEPYESRNKLYSLPTVKFYLLVVMSIVCFFGNGFFPSIQSYTCLPYGNIVYHLSVTLSQFANPAVCFLAFWILPRSLIAIHYILLGIIVSGGYVLYLGLTSPFPILQHSPVGKILVVMSWIIVTALISYTKLIIASIFRFKQEAKSLFYIGMVMQIGSGCGAIVSFTLIKCTNYFQMYDSCLQIVN